VIKDKIAGRVFREKEGKITKLKEIFNEEHHNFYTPPEEYDGRGFGEVRNAYRILVRMSEGKRPTVKLRRRYEDYIELGALKG
jgi:hypothetical protein